MTISTVVRDCFSGRWRFERRVTDHRDGAEGWMTGWAAFDQVGDSINYSAEGKLEMRGAKKPVTEFHRIRFVTPGRVEVHYNSGELFHKFDPRLTNPKAEHRHRGDLYQVEYDFHRAWEWKMSVHVTGEGKDYTAETWFRR